MQLPIALLAAVLGGGYVTAACIPRVADAEAVSRELYELERMAFVPPGRCELPGYAAPFNDFEVERALLVDLFEATVGDWLHYFGEADPGPASTHALTDASETWPAFFTQVEARELGQRRGVRLLTAGEWLYCAVGPRGHPWPWGASFQTSVANTLELALDRPAPVGTFEGGRGPFGCYDQVGNVWEWVSDRVPGRGDAWVLGPTHVGAVSAMGGSFRSRASPTFGLREEGATRDPVFEALALAPTTRATDIGARFGADAEVYLWRQAPRWGTDSGVRRRLVAVGRRFGPEARVLLEGLAARDGAPPGLAWLAEGAAR